MLFLITPKYSRLLDGSRYLDIFLTSRAILGDISTPSGLKPLLIRRSIKRLLQPQFTSRAKSLFSTKAIDSSWGWIPLLWSN